jgi:hypothetical protein
MVRYLHPDINLCDLKKVSEKIVAKLHLDVGISVAILVVILRLCLSEELS